MKCANDPQCKTASFAQKESTCALTDDINVILNSMYNSLVIKQSVPGKRLILNVNMYYCCEALSSSISFTG